MVDFVFTDNPACDALTSSVVYPNRATAVNDHNVDVLFTSLTKWEICEAILTWNQATVM